MRPIATPPRLKGTFHQAMMWPHESPHWRRSQIGQKSSSSSAHGRHAGMVSDDSFYSDMSFDCCAEVEKATDLGSSRQGESNFKGTFSSYDLLPEAEFTLWQRPTYAATTQRRPKVKEHAFALTVERSPLLPSPPAPPCQRGTFAGEFAHDVRNKSTVKEKSTYGQYIRRNIHRHMRRTAHYWSSGPLSGKPPSPDGQPSSLITYTEVQSVKRGSIISPHSNESPAKQRPQNATWLDEMCSTAVSAHAAVSTNTKIGKDKVAADPVDKTRDLKVPPGCIVLWEWEHRTGWIGYEEEVAMRVETAYQQKEAYVRAKTGKKGQEKPMEIWFNEMLQYDAVTGNSRKVQRRVVSKKTKEEEDARARSKDLKG
mmetsp:Transcript_135778/g.290357  ORF Transcript_135778/g.290357 Transcript_135778/m.290357 type:complete len:369 (+) Transcript_135778:72-1178(+)